MTTTTPASTDADAGDLTEIQQADIKRQADLAQARADHKARMTAINCEFADTVREVRDRNNMTMTAIAIELGCSRHTLYELVPTERAHR